MQNKSINYRRIIIYNIFAVLLLLSSVELTSRTVSWITGKGFFLSVDELDPYDSKLKDTYQWHPFTGFIFAQNVHIIGSHPNQKTKSSILTDKYGFLSKDNNLDYKKPPNEIRIATIGGSTTANIGLNYDENWPGYLGNLLQNNFPDKHFRIINAGVPGFDTAQSISNLSLRVMPFKPDIVIIYHAYNDLKAIRPDLTFKPDYSHIHTTPYGFHKEPNFLIKILNKSMFYVRTRNTYRKYKESKKYYNEIMQYNEKRLSSIPEMAEQTFEEHVRELISIANAGKATVILSTFATLNNPTLEWSKKERFKAQTDFQNKSLLGIVKYTPGLTFEGVFDGINKYNNILRRVSKEENCGLVDNANLIPHEDKYFVDRVHFSAIGAKKMAENIYPVIVQSLKNSGLLK